ncbi:hypothetical protein MN116_003718 [Schistosoma mekongi]|uniref:Uncharacterized protein n=1 Tax=Schistosoma mekongi TaxID=38744 RepID=A0AAE1ZEX0_SCHME|nr:hypothetical protein MN116_003718 [Schistosoma mekongi]
MANRRKMDVIDPDFTVIRHQLAKLMQHSISDCKSFLLMIKSLFPNSIKLEMIEYELMKEYGDSTLASEILCRLYEKQRHFDTTQIELLSKIVTDPTDIVCCDIFSRLTPPLQRNLALSYCKQVTDDLKRAENIIFLLNMKDISLNPQIPPMLLALAYQSLIDGERSMRRRNRMSASSDTKLNSSPVNDCGTLVKTDDSDDGEEGEVIGCDEEDEFVDEPDNLDSASGDNSWTNMSSSVLNVCRFKITYELLPLAYKINAVSKVDKNIMYNISVTSINFLVTYITHIPAYPSIEGLEKNEFSARKEPVTYISDCLKMIGHLLQWSVNTYDFTSSESLPYLVQLTKDLFQEARCSCEAVSTKRDSRSGRKTITSSTFSHKSYPIVFQALCMFWYTFVNLSTTYLHKVHSRMFDGSTRKDSLPGVLYLPINLDVLFNSTFSKNVLSIDNEETTLLNYIYDIWRLREYTSTSYSFGNKEMDSSDGIHPCTDGSSDVGRETLFEQIIRLHFALSGLNNTQQEIIWACDFVNKCSNQIKSVFLQTSHSDPYNSAELKFIFRILQMLLLSLNHDKNKVVIKSGVYSGLWDEFVQEFKSLSLLINQSKDEKIRIQNVCSLVPFTRQCVVFVVSKTLATRLCDISRRTKDPTVAVNSACLACILCQVDTRLNDVFHASPYWPSLFPYLSEVMHTHWTTIRNRFSKWILPSCTFIFDVSLLNTIFQLECNVGMGTYWSDRDAFLSRCSNLVQSKSPDEVDSVLVEFIHAESLNISVCLASFP